ncbi:MAG TPA: hypothetical protein VGG48_18855 [Rhizomicrobium sp.]|jgi:hypothetical protein
MRIRHLALGLLAGFVFIAPALAAPASTTYPVLTGPTLYTITPYFDGQVGAATGAGAELRPVLADGYSAQRSTALIEPIGDGLVVRVEVWINLATDDITQPGEGYMMIAGLPPMDGNVGAGTAMFGFSGNFQGLQFLTGGNVSIDAAQSMNDTYGSRWFIVVSYPNTLPVNCEWSYDPNPNLVNPCWLSAKSLLPLAAGKTPARFRGDVSYLTSWANVAPWLQTQTKAGLVKQVDPRPK